MPAYCIECGDHRRGRPHRRRPDHRRVHLPQVRARALLPREGGVVHLPQVQGARHAAQAGRLLVTPAAGPSPAPSADALLLDDHRAPRRDQLADGEDVLVVHAHAAVTHRLADKPRLVGAVDRHRAALRPARELRLEGADADRESAVGAAGLRRLELLVDEEGARRRLQTRAPDGDRVLAVELAAPVDA